MASVETVQELIGAIQTGFVVYDRSGRYVTVNESYASLFGVEPERLEGAGIWETNPEFERQRFESYWESFEEGDTWIAETTHRFDGTSVPVRTRTVREQLEGTVYHFGTVQDMTELRENKQERIKFRQAVEASGHAIFLTDASGSIQYVNKAFQEITEYDAQEVLGKTPDILSSGQMPAEYWERFWETITAGKQWEEEVINKRKSGEYYHANQTVSPILDQDGEIQTLLAVQDDITERIEREQTLSTIGRVMRHNLRNRLNVLLSAGQNLETADSTQIEQSRQQILETVDRLNDISEKGYELVEFLSTDTYRCRVDLADAVDATVNSVREQHPSARIDVELPETAPVLAVKRITRAVEELLVNAIVHNDDREPVVAVRITEQGGASRLEIRDNGPAIPEMEQQVLGEHPTMDQLYHASGLGLWLVYWIVRRSGGTVRVEENDPRGNVVTLSFEQTAVAMSK